MLKILQINKYYYLRGGSERYLFDLSKQLKEKGHRVITFSMQDARNHPSRFADFFIKSVNVNKFSLKNIFKSYYNYDAVHRLKRLIAAEKPDIAHLHNIANHLSPAIISVLHKNNIKIVQTLHDYKLICPNRQLYSRNEVCYKCRGEKFYHCLTRKCVQDSYAISFLGMIEAYLHNKFFKTYDLIDMFIAPSEYMKDICVSFGLPKEKIKVMPNFIADSFLDSVNSDVPDKKKEKYFLYFGRLSKEKGIEVLLEAMKKYKGGTKLKIVGAGGGYTKLKRIIDSEKLSRKVKLLGPKYGDQLKEIIDGAKTVIMPSLWPENLPYSLIEAMALGKIVIASDIGGIPEIIQDGENGFLFKAGDWRDLLDKIELSERFDQTGVSLKARHSIKKYSQSEHIKKILILYKNLLKFI
jgi:glycosyltransferase involved in cell wall biosynthesis